MKLIYKIILPVILITGLFIFFVGFLSLDSIKNGLYQEEFLRFQGNILKDKTILSADYFKDPFSQLSQSKFEEFFDRINTPSIARLIIWDAKQTAIFSDLKSIIGFHSPEHQDVLRVFKTGGAFFEFKNIDVNKPVESTIGDFLDVYVPIELHGQLLGVIEAHLVVESLVEPVNSQLRTIIIIMTGAGGLIIAGIFFILRFFVIKPIGQLEKVSREIIKGNFDYKLFSDSKDEIGNLTRNFDGMRRSLKVSVENLKEERDRSRAIISSMGEGLFVVDKDNKVILLNLAAEKMLEVSFKKAQGKSILDIFEFFEGEQKISLEERPLIKTIKTGQSIAADLDDNYYFQTASGKKFPVAFATAPLIGNGITGAVVVFKDITNEKKLDEAKDSFISIASHQLRSPLTSIKWFSEMMQGGDAGPLTDEQKQFMTYIYQGTNRMIDIINLLLQIARLEAGRVRIAPEPLDLKKFTDEVITSLKVPLGEKRQHMVTVTEPNLPLISMDHGILWQVIQNLLTNAIRYSPQGGEIRISLLQKKDYLEYSVRDRGIGIPLAQCGRIFEKFFRADNALVAVPEGSGLGLSLVKQLVNGWGGTIWFETEEGKGTTFFFTIPLIGMKSKEGDVVLSVGNTRGTV